MDPVSLSCPVHFNPHKGTVGPVVVGSDGRGVFCLRFLTRLLDPRGSDSNGDGARVVYDPVIDRVCRPRVTGPRWVKTPVSRRPVEELWDVGCGVGSLQESRSCPCTRRLRFALGIERPHGGGCIDTVDLI